MRGMNLKNTRVVTACMHTEKMHVFYLKECEDTKCLIVVEEDLLTNGHVNTFVVPHGNHIEATGYILQFIKKGGFLMLSYPPCRFVIWDVTTRETILSTETRGKNPYFMRNYAFNESTSVLFYTAVGQRNIYCCRLIEEANTYTFSKNTKIQLPKKVAVYDLKSQPNDIKIVAACSDGCIRIWNSGSVSYLKGISDPQAQSNGAIELISDASGEFVHATKFFTCMEFSSDGSKLLVGTSYGHVYCIDARQLGNRHSTLASFAASPNAILSCKWLNYNGFASATRSMHFLVLSSEVNLTLFTYTAIQPLSKAPTASAQQAKIAKDSLIYSQKQDIKFQDYYAVNMVFEKYLQVHDFANVVMCTTFKRKSANSFDQMNRNTVQRTSRVFMLFDQLYDSLDYPLVSPQFVHTFPSLLPNKSKQITFQRDQFTVDNLDVKMVSSVRETIKTVASLKNILNSDDIRFYGIDARPIRMEYARRAKYLLFYRMDGHAFTTSFNVSLEKDEEESKKEEQIVNYLAIQSQQALFLGDPKYANPPVFYLSEDASSYTIDCHLDFIDSDLKSYLLEDGYSSATGDTLSKKELLFTPVSRIFATPLRRGFTMIYRIIDDSSIGPRLCFSRNRIPSNKPLDFQPYLSDSAPILRLTSTDDIVDIIWANNSQESNLTQSNVPDSNQIGAIIYMKRIQFINADLRVIRSVSVLPSTSCNFIHSAKWFGPTLFYITRTHVHYLTVDGTTNPVISLDAYEAKQTIATILIDRMIIASRSNMKKKNASAPIEFKTKSFSAIEPLLCGYLSMRECLKLPPNEAYIAEIIEAFQAANISPILLGRLQKSKLHHLCYFYVYNSENKQLPSLQKAQILEQMLKTDGILELVFPNRNMDRETGIIDVVKRVQSDPKFVGETSSLRHLLKYYLMIGEFEHALLIAHLLQDFNVMFIIAKATKIQPLLQNLVAAFMTTKLANNLHSFEKYILKQCTKEQEGIEEVTTTLKDEVNTEKDTFGKTENFAYSIVTALQKAGQNSIRSDAVLREIAQLDPELAAQIERVLSKHDMGQAKQNFGDTLYKQVYLDLREEDRADADETTQPEIQTIEPLQFDSIISYLGLHSHFSEASKGIRQNHAGGAGHQHGQNDDAEGDVEEEPDENKDILILWRFDEGKGTLVGDLSNYETDGELISAENGKQLMPDKIWQSFDDNSPLEVEDIWGKRVPVQYSLVFNNGENGLSCVKTVRENWCSQKLKKMKEFTMELWVKIKAGNNGEGSLIRSMSSATNETTFELRLIKSEVVVFYKGTQLKLSAFKEEDDEGNGAAGSAPQQAAAAAAGSLVLPPGVWTHIAVQMEEQFKLTVFVNCKDLFASEETLDGSVFEIFKGKSLVIGSQDFRGEITEMRFRKEKLQLTQIRDQYKSPLPIVSDKKKKIIFKVNEKKNNNTAADSNKPAVFNFGMPPIVGDSGNANNLNDDDASAMEFQSVSNNYQYSTNSKSATAAAAATANTSSSGSKQFAFGMPPIVEEIPSASTSAPPVNKFVFSMPTIIRDNEPIEEAEAESKQQSKANTKSHSEMASNFDDFSSFGQFGDTSKKDSGAGSAATAFGQFGGSGSSFSDPFSAFSTSQPANRNSRPRGDSKSDQFSGFSMNNDASSAFGMFPSSNKSKEENGSGEKQANKGDFMTATNTNFFGFDNNNNNNN